MAYEFWLAPILIVVTVIAVVVGYRKLQADRVEIRAKTAKIFADFERDDARRLRREANEEAIKRKAAKIELKRVRAVERDETAAILGLISEAAILHKSTLRAKRRQTVLTDEYGIVDRSRWDQEIRYFIDRVVDPQAAQWGRAKFDGSNYFYTFFGRRIEEHIEGEQGEADSLSVYQSDMSGVDFENLVAERLISAGARVRFTPSTGDHGADLIAMHDGRTVVIQCKRSASSIGNKAVQEAYSGCGFHSGDEAWVVSDAPFTRQAQQLATSLSVRLVALEHLEGALEVSE